MVHVFDPYVENICDMQLDLMTSPLFLPVKVFRLVFINKNLYSLSFGVGYQTCYIRQPNNTELIDNAVSILANPIIWNEG